MEVGHKSAIKFYAPQYVRLSSNIKEVSDAS